MKIKKRIFDSFLEIFQRKELVVELTKRQLTISHKGSALGLVWIILNPLLLLGLYIVVFGFIFQGKIQSAEPESRFEYGLTIFLGLTVIHFLSEVLNSAPRSMFAHANFLQRTTIPIQIIPVSTFLTAVMHLLVSGALVIVGLLVLQKGFSVNILWAFPIMGCLFLTGLGLSWLLASLGTLFKDISEIMPSLSMAMLFGSAVFYPTDQIPSSIWMYLRFNPVLHIVNELRSTVLWHNSIDTRAFMYILICSFTTVLLGWIIFQLTKEQLSEKV